MTDDELKVFLEMLFSDFAAKQGQLGEEFERIWSENVEELYES